MKRQVKSPLKNTMTAKAGTTGSERFPAPSPARHSGSLLPLYIANAVTYIPQAKASVPPLRRELTPVEIRNRTGSIPSWVAEAGKPTFFTRSRSRNRLLACAPSATVGEPGDLARLPNLSLGIQAPRKVGEPGDLARLPNNHAAGIGIIRLKNRVIRSGNQTLHGKSYLSQGLGNRVIRRGNQTGHAVYIVLLGCLTAGRFDLATKPVLSSQSRSERCAAG